jgi:hypothetical protein
LAATSRPVGNRHEWFVEFEHWFKASFDAVFGGRAHAEWLPEVSESEWRASVHQVRGGAAATADLPHNFAWFKPQPVAHSVLVRLRDQVEALEMGSRRSAS